MTDEPVIAAIAKVATLADEVRWRLHAAVLAADRPLTREEAAAAVGISRKLAAFHLDKLVEAGLLVAGPRPGPQRVGRVPKAYRTSDTDIQISIPSRRPDLLADILLDAVLVSSHPVETDHPSPGNPTDAAIAAAHERGRAAGAAERSVAKPGRLGPERAVALAAAVLGRHGFEPVRVAPDRLVLRACPFHPLVARAPRLVCSVNHAFLGGLLEGLGATAVAALPAAGTGGCCVEVAPPGR